MNSVNQNKMSLFDLAQKQFFEAYTKINETVTYITELLSLKESYTKILQEKTEEVKFGSADKTVEPLYVINPATYDKSVIPNLVQDRMFTAKNLLQRRIVSIGAQKKYVSHYDIRLTHNLPFVHSWKPTVQMIESFIIFQGEHHKTDYVINIPRSNDINKYVWDFRLEVKGKFNHSHLDSFLITVDGMKFDKYSRKWYDNIILLPGTTDTCHIPLDFWMKNMNRALCRNLLIINATIHITNVPSDVTINLIAKELTVDQDLSRALRNNGSDFQQVNIHKEKIIPADETNITFESKYYMVLRYGLATDSHKPIYHVIESIDGIPIETLCGIQKIDCNDTVIWFELVCPVRADMLLIKITRKMKHPLVLVYEHGNFIMTENIMILKYIDIV